MQRDAALSREDAEAVERQVLLFPRQIYDLPSQFPQLHFLARNVLKLTVKHLVAVLPVERQFQRQLLWHERALAFQLLLHLFQRGQKLPLLPFHL